MRQLLDYLIAPEELHSLKLYRNRCLTPNQGCSPATKKETDGRATSRRDNGLKASIRLSGRVFLAGSIVLTIVDRLRLRLHRSDQPRLWNGLGVRVPLSLSILLLLHRSFHRIVVHIQSRLLRFSENASQPTISTLRKALLSPIAPSGAAALSGVALASIPSEDARLTISIYVFTKTMEYLSNALHISDRTPWWFGSWTLFPFALAQLFRTMLSGEGEIPFIYRKALMSFPVSDADQPQDHLTVSRMADVARLQFPTFNSTILFPRKEPVSVGMKSVFREAHPAIRHLSCAISHPKSVSCLGAWAAYCVRQFRRNAQVFSIFYSILFLSKFGSFRGSLLAGVSELVRKVIRTSTFTTSAVATSWSALCLCQRILPKKLLGPQVFYISGFLGGLMAFIDRTQSHLVFLDAARGAMLSWWKTKKGSRYLRGLPSPDILLFVASIATLNIIYDIQPKAITSKGARKVIELLRGPSQPAEGISKDLPDPQTTNVGNQNQL